MASGSGDGGAHKPRRQCANTKTGAIKQIEAWARNGREMKVECGRNVGKLNDNVTEERMLQARIWELSRERYKFLSQAEYEKRTFLDRQLRKSAICREITKSMEGGRGGGAGEGGEMKRALERRESVRTLNKGSSSQLRSGTDKDHGATSTANSLHLPAVLSRTKHGQLTAAGTVGGDKYDVDDDDEPSFFGAHDAELGLDKRRSRMFPTEPTHPVRYKSNLAMREACGGNAHSAPVKRRISFAADQSESQNADQRRRHREQRATAVKPIDDPRYQLLERCLCEKWSRKGAFAAPEVAGVIRNNPSLCMPSKRGKDRKSSIAVKFLRMLSEQGWVF